MTPDPTPTEIPVETSDEERPILAGIEQARQDMAETIAEIKPKLRGWLHAGSTPLVLSAGTVLITLSGRGDKDVAQVREIFGRAGDA